MFNCPFCPQNLSDKYEISKRGNYWIVAHKKDRDGNIDPVYVFIAIGLPTDWKPNGHNGSHITNISQIHPAGFAEFLNLLKKIPDIKSGQFFSQWGPTTKDFNGHTHFHIEIRVNK